MRGSPLQGAEQETHSGTRPNDIPPSAFIELPFHPVPELKPRLRSAPRYLFGMARARGPPAKSIIYLQRLLPLYDLHLEQYCHPKKKRWPRSSHPGQLVLGIMMALFVQRIVDARATPPHGAASCFVLTPKIRSQRKRFVPPMTYRPRCSNFGRSHPGSSVCSSCGVRVGSVVT